MDHTQLDHSDLNSPRRELSNGGLESVIALTVYWQINFVCVCVADRQPSCKYLKSCVMSYVSTSSKKNSTYKGHIEYLDTHCRQNSGHLTSH